MTFAQYERLGLHVAASWREVVRAASRMVADDARHARNVRDARHKFYRSALSQHIAARRLWKKVLSGNV